MTNPLFSETILDQAARYETYDAFDFHSLIPKNLRIAIYGTGQRGEEFYAFVTKMRPDITVVAFVDSQTKGEKYKLPVIGPEELLQGKAIDVVVICSVYLEQIIGVLKYFSISSYIVFNTYNRLSDGFIKKYNKHLAAFRSALYCDQDKQLFDLILRFRKSYTESVYSLDEYIKTIRAFNFEDQYTDFINKDVIKTILDCGSFDGDSANIFLEKCKNVEKIYCIDAFHGMETVEKSYPMLLDDQRVCFNVIGLSDKVSTKYGRRNPLYPVGDGLSDRPVGHDSQVLVKCTTVDRFVRENCPCSPDLIKMDIENFELKALLGALDTISAKRMQYAICIYHSEQHLFQIFDFFSKHVTGYVYRLGQYNYQHVQELVLYAIPEELYVHDQQAPVR